MVNYPQLLSEIAVEHFYAPVLHSANIDALVRRVAITLQNIYTKYQPVRVGQWPLLEEEEYRTALRAFAVKVAHALADIFVSSLLHGVDEVELMQPFVVVLDDYLNEQELGSEEYI